LVSTLADYFFFVSGTSAPHLKAIADSLDIELKKKGQPVYRRSGDAESGWLLLDYVDVVVHIMTIEARAYYDLESLWSDAPRVVAVP